MAHRERKHLPHDVPLWVDPQKEVYFLTVNCRQRGRQQLTLPAIAPALLEAVAFRQQQHLWFAHLFLVMPDHVHGLVSFPPSKRTLQGVVSDWKRWTARQLRIAWQDDFFEHRLRNDESAREKADYILGNPVRKGLVNRPEDWPHVWFGGSLLRTDRG
jgi:REP element-mobilizing transposase RayT